MKIIDGTLIADEHLIFRSCGRYIVSLGELDGRDCVEIHDTKRNCHVRRDFWEPDLSELDEFLNNEMGEVKDLTKEEIVFLVGVMASIEQDLELGRHDVEKFGAVGISG